MPLIRVKNRKTGTISEVGQAWLDRWPDDFERLDQEPEPAEKPAAPEASAPAEEPKKTRRQAARK